MIYDFALQDDHDIIANGVPALLKVCPQITREIYSYRDIVTTVVITNETPKTYEESGKSILARYFDAITKFAQIEDTKGLVIRIKRLVHDGLVVTNASLYSIILNLDCIHGLDTPSKVKTQSVDMSGNSR